MCKPQNVKKLFIGHFCNLAYFYSKFWGMKLHWHNFKNTILLNYSISSLICTTFHLSYYLWTFNLFLIFAPIYNILIQISFSMDIYYWKCMKEELSLQPDIYTSCSQISYIFQIINLDIYIIKAKLVLFSILFANFQMLHIKSATFSPFVSSVM